MSWLNYVHNEYISLCFIFIFTTPTILFRCISYYGDTLQFQAFETWGAQLRNQFGIIQEIQREELKRKDITLNYLGYWTDNGTVVLENNTLV